MSGFLLLPQLVVLGILSLGAEPVPAGPASPAAVVEEAAASAWVPHILDTFDTGARERAWTEENLAVCKNDPRAQGVTTTQAHSGRHSWGLHYTGRSGCGADDLNMGIGLDNVPTSPTGDVYLSQWVYFARPSKGGTLYGQRKLFYTWINRGTNTSHFAFIVRNTEDDGDQILHLTYRARGLSYDFYNQGIHVPWDTWHRFEILFRFAPSPANYSDRITIWYDGKDVSKGFLECDEHNPSCRDKTLANTGLNLRPATGPGSDRTWTQIYFGYQFDPAFYGGGGRYSRELMGPTTASNGTILLRLHDTKEVRNGMDLVLSGLTPALNGLCQDLRIGDATSLSCSHPGANGSASGGTAAVVADEWRYVDDVTIAWSRPNPQARPSRPTK